MKPIHPSLSATLCFAILTTASASLLNAQSAPAASDLAYHQPVVSLHKPYTEPGYSPGPATDDMGNNSTSLESFTASINTQGIHLKWSVKPGNSKTSYEIERSVGGSSFIKIGKVNSGSQKMYQFTDRFIYQPSYYYRIRISGASGESTYSRILLVNRKAKSAVGTKASPPEKKAIPLSTSATPLRFSLTDSPKNTRPASAKPLKIKSQLTFQCQSSGREPIRVAISGHNGRVDLHREFANPGKEGNITLDGLDLLPPGKYRILIRCGRKSIQLQAIR